MDEWLVDTNVLLDVIGAHATFGRRSLATLERLGRSGVLVINPVIYAEVGAGFTNRESLDAALPINVFRCDLLPWDARFLAGVAFMRYRQQRGRRDCILADFLIGAHVAAAGFGLVTRDRRCARFFKLDLVDPADAK